MLADALFQGHIVCVRSASTFFRAEMICASLCRALLIARPLPSSKSYSKMDGFRRAGQGLGMQTHGKSAVRYTLLPAGMQVLRVERGQSSVFAAMASNGPGEID